MTKRRPATLIEVAERAGVSLTTASKAINGKNRVSEATRARVLAAARELSFTPSPIARGLTGGRTSTVGLIVADSMTHRFAVPIMLGAEAALGEIDLSMITCDARGDQARSLELARMLAARKVDGLLIVGDNNAVTASVTRQVDVPVVYVYGESDDPGDVVHMPDDGAGIGLAVDHLAAIGRRRIVHLTGPAATTAVAHRVAGLAARLREHRLDLAAPVRYGEWSQRWARAAATSLLRQDQDIDAVLCGSDQIASGVLVALDETRAAGAGRRRRHRIRQLARVRAGDRAPADHRGHEPGSAGRRGGPGPVHHHRWRRAAGRRPAARLRPHHPRVHRGLDPVALQGLRGE